MRYLESIDQLSSLDGPLALAIGVFDGVHIGHQAVIGHAVGQAARAGGTAVVVSFRPHPQRILNPDVAPGLLTSTPHKVRILQRIGVENLLMIAFSREFSRLTPQEFIARLCAAAPALHSISVGAGWSFGRNREGNLELLGELGAHHGFEVTGVPEVHFQGKPVSSTRIREAVAGGDFAAVNAMLGRPLSLFGTVVEGRRIGREIGFPTANVSIQNEQLPPPGVYAAHTMLHTEPLPSVVNLGRRPTVADEHGAVGLEVHVIDFYANLYGIEIEVEILEPLREERKFDSLEELRGQIEYDVARAREICARSATGNRPPL